MKPKSTLVAVLALLLLGFISPALASSGGKPKDTVGSKCEVKYQEIAQAGGKGGTQICAPFANGLRWEVSTTMVADSQMAKTLPSCGVNRTLSTTISMYKKSALITAASNYYEKRGLALKKTNAVSQLDLSLNLVGLHPCSNGVGVPLGNWIGVLPVSAKAGWILDVTLSPKKGLESSQLIFIAEIGTGLHVVAEGSGP